MKKLDKIIKEYNLGKIKEVELLYSSQNKVYKVTTDKNIYVIKEFSKDAIGNYYYLRKRKEQIRISKVLNKYGIKTSYPITIKNKMFSLFNNRYYLIYNFLEERPLENSQLTLEHVQILAKTQAKIHKLNIKSTLPCSYKHINIDIDKEVELSKKVNKELYEVINNNKDILKEIISKCNNKTKIMKDNLFISHNDYKLLNILWKDKELILIDFDATGLSNPSCCLCESAYTFAKYNNSIRSDYYYEYVSSYLLEFGDIKESYKDALYASFNGKLQWLKYLLDNKKTRFSDVIHMTNELVLYYNNIDKLDDIYNDVKKTIL